MIQELYDIVRRALDNSSSYAYASGKYECLERAMLEIAAILRSSLKQEKIARVLRRSEWVWDEEGECVCLTCLNTKEFGHTSVCEVKLLLEEFDEHKREKPADCQSESKTKD